LQVPPATIEHQSSIDPTRPHPCDNATSSLRPPHPTTLNTYARPNRHAAACETQNNQWLHTPAAPTPGSSSTSNQATHIINT
ncbi:hypothetical protein BDV93DRAFT_612404, partial [Ceratobasidium sp. AG-I]